MRVGLVSDTHGLFRSELNEAFSDVDLILHAGDVGPNDIIEKLQLLAPVVAIKGNIDRTGRAATLSDEERVEAAGRTIHILHDLKTLSLDPVIEGIDVVMSGHSHKPLIQSKDGVLYVNPGSAGPRRFKLPIAYGLLELAEDVEASIVEIPI